MPTHFISRYVDYRNKNKNKVNKRRRKELRAWRKWRQQLESKRFDQDSNSDEMSASRRHLAYSKVLHDSPFSLEIQNENGETAISISEIGDPKPRRWETVRESGENPISRLTSLLQAGPLAAIREEVGKSKYMEVFLDKYKIADLASVNPDKAVKEGAKRAFVVENGRIKEHAQLLEPNQLMEIISAGLAWQIASLAVAQKHLHDINKKLEAIDRKIEDVHAFQKNERISQILGCRKYFVQISEDIENGIIIPGRSKTVIESQCVEILKVEEHLRLDLKEAFDRMKEAELGEEFSEQLSGSVELVQQLFFCIETRLLGYSLMAIECEDENFVSNRLNGVRRDMGYLEGLVAHFADCIVDKLGEEASFWGNIGKFEEALSVLKHLQLRDEFEKLFGHVYEEFKMARSIIEQRKEPQEILLKVNGEKIEGFAVAEDVNQ